ncbi:MAG: DUF4340 domain-containing protein [Planctomycetes bacterium]|nr:DUF4340 domain-containing protein [Planctomycetota bacterium]
MNFKTTFFLAVVFLGLVLGYTMFRPSDASGPVASDGPQPRAPDDVARSVWTDEPGEIVKIVCRRKGEDEDWVFERQEKKDDGGQGEWRITAPFDAPAVRWEIDGIARQLTGLKHDVSYKIGDGGVTLAQAGLEPPLVRVTLTDEKGKSVRVDVGTQASSNTTYLRIDEGDVIFEAKASLKGLVKQKALDYRDKALWSFDDKHATRVEIVDHTDGGDVNYVLVRSGGRWMFESPVSTRATSKVDQMLTSMKNLRVAEWVKNRSGRLAAFGLAPPTVSVRVTVTEEVEVDAEPAEKTEADSDETDTTDTAEKTEADSDETDAADTAKKTEVRTDVYEIHLSDRSPIGEDTKTYVSFGDEAFVGTIMKTVADKFRPVMSEWREMRIATTGLKSASKIDMTTAEGRTILVKRDGQWFFDEEDMSADASQVSGWLQELSTLEAVAFVDGEVQDLGEFGLDAPKADIRLTIPGVEEVERITIGGYTDARTKRLIFVRRNQVASVAKVRASDGESLIRSPLAFRDRTVINVPSDRVQRVHLQVNNAFADGRTDITLERRDEKWVMTAPVEAPVRQDDVQKLADSLANLQAAAIVGLGDTASSFGLHAPTSTVTLTYAPLESPTEKIPPEPESLRLDVTEHDGKIYARLDGVDTVYELAQSFNDRLAAEYRVGEVVVFDDEVVRSFTISRGSEEHVFERDEATWRYKLEPDLPLDQEKVTNLLLQLHDMKTERFVVYSTEDLSPYGLADPFLVATVELEDGSSVALHVSNRTCSADPQHRRYAGSDGVPGVFLLSPDTVDRLSVSLADLETR